MLTQPLTQLEQEVFDYLNDTPNAREAICKHCAGSGYDSYPNYSTSYPICTECEGTGKTPAARIETLAARISHELDVRYSEALVIVEKWRDSL
jgi:DnaJ-class molecular chaperone